MKIAGVDVPGPLLNALRDGELVVFAGAGVSMGPPANLPDFGRLADQVAQGTLLTKGDDEPEDRFLDRLEESGLDVHQRAADVLQRSGPEPTTLHHNILRLHPRPEDVRVVTTNFDLLFEKAAAGEFSAAPRVYCAPALPLGSDFRGLVHVHGSVDDPGRMILTSQDFGRAYLTQSDGWARRFLVDLFGNNVVLFVGYSHRDTIMTYLTPSLPRTDLDRRFAVVGNLEDDGGLWRRMGITPLVFAQANSGDFSGLDVFIDGLANHVRRGILDWRREINSIGSAVPPVNEETGDMIERALETPEHVRFFIETADSPEWISWLDLRGSLDALFADGELIDTEKTLSYWLTTRFAVQHPDMLFPLMGRHGGRLNSHFWRDLARTLWTRGTDDLDPRTLSRWVHFLVRVIPPDAPDFLLSGLGQACAALGLLDNLLQIYDALALRRSALRPGLEGGSYRDREYVIRELWDKSLRPNLAEIARSLLERTSIHLQNRRSYMVAWEQATEDWDRDSHIRSTIEPDSERGLVSELDVLVDIARDSLEWLAETDPAAVGIWSGVFAASDAPLMRRLAVHAMANRTDLSADEKLGWLLDRCDVNDIQANHEISRAAALAYAGTNAGLRRRLVQTIVGYKLPDRGVFNHDPGITEAHYRLRWFRRLQQADPNCATLKQTIDDVLDRYPDLKDAEYREPVRGWRSIRVKGPWPPEELLGKPASEWLSDLVAYQPTEGEISEGYDRRAMLQDVSAAVRTDSMWGLDLADAMSGQHVWETDLWQHVITAWAPAQLDPVAIDRLLVHLSAGDLYPRHCLVIADLLGNLVQDISVRDSSVLLPKANSIASALQPYAGCGQVPGGIPAVGAISTGMGWPHQAVNHLSGRLADYWVRSIACWRRSQDPVPQSLTDEYGGVLNAICLDNSLAGKLGRTVLASQLHLMLIVDERWAVDNLLPLFGAGHEDFRCAWEGFLTWGYLSPEVPKHLEEAFISAVRVLGGDSEESMLGQFLKYYVSAMSWSITGAGDRWITELFQHAVPETKRLFAVEIGHRLRDLDEAVKDEWWRVWLKDYWNNRINGTPSSLEESEISWMMQWVLYLPGVFEEAVGLAVRMPMAPVANPSMLYGLGENPLVDRCPQEIAKFLVHLGKRAVEPWFWYGTKAVVDRLRAVGLPEDLDIGLQELDARYFLGE